MTLSFGGTALLGALAGATIFLGIPVARIGRPPRPVTSFLTAASVGVLLFILVDVVRRASDQVEAELDRSRPHGWFDVALLVVGVGVGLLGLVAVERLSGRQRRDAVSAGPGAVVAATATRTGHTMGAGAAQRVALYIAMGMGFHNFSEGLAIGQSSASGAYQLFALLVMGFAAHNVTEGFGVTAPLIGSRPSWPFLGLLGLIGGGPTTIGTLIGYQFTSAPVSIFFLALAAGAIMYVIGELQHAGRKIGNHGTGMIGLLTGFVAGYVTDVILHIAGA